MDVPLGSAQSIVFQLGDLDLPIDMIRIGGEYIKAFVDMNAPAPTHTYKVVMTSSAAQQKMLKMIGMLEEGALARRGLQILPWK